MRKKSETMKSRPHPYFWKLKIKVQKIKLSVSGVRWKLKVRMAQEMKTAVLSVCSKKNLALNYKIKTSPENGQPHPFHPTQLLLWTLPDQLSILHHACVPTNPEPTSQDTLQTSIRKFSSHTSLFRTLPEQLLTDDTTHVCQPILNQCCKDTPQNLRP